MHQRWTYRCYPTPDQEMILARTFGCVRYVFNWGLERREAARKAGEKISYAALNREMTALRGSPGHEWLADVCRDPLDQALRDLDRAYSAFFAKRAGHPTFKKKGARGAARYHGYAVTLRNERLALSKLGVLRVKWDRRLPSEPSSVTVIRAASGRYFISCVVEEAVSPLPTTGQAVGIDFGIAALATLSTGERIENPRHLSARARRLVMLQRRAAKKARGSKRRLLAQRAVARCYEKIASARKDALHKLTTRLIRENDAIYVEDLNLRGMVKNHAIARSLSDVGIGIAVQMLERKAEMYGRSVARVGRFFPSSKMCSDCGHVSKAMSLKVREWTCDDCGSVHDRDHNAAINILVAGQAMTARGESVGALAA